MFTVLLINVKLMSVYFYVRKFIFCLQDYPAGLLEWHLSILDPETGEMKDKIDIKPTSKPKKKKKKEWKRVTNIPISDSVVLKYVMNIYRPLYTLFLEQRTHRIPVKLYSLFCVRLIF